MNKACETGEVREVWHEMAGCDHCGTCVRWDLQDHPFFGFQNCPKKGQAEPDEEWASTVAALPDRKEP